MACSAQSGQGCLSAPHSRVSGAYHGGTDEKGEWGDVDSLWTIVIMVLIGVPLFLGLRYLATKRAIEQARRRRADQGR